MLRAIPGASCSSPFDATHWIASAIFLLPSEFTRCTQMYNSHRSILQFVEVCYIWNISLALVQVWFFINESRFQRKKVYSPLHHFGWIAHDDLCSLDAALQCCNVQRGAMPQGHGEKAMDRTMGYCFFPSCTYLRATTNRLWQCVRKYHVCFMFDSNPQYVDE